MGSLEQTQISGAAVEEPPTTSLHNLGPDYIIPSESLTTWHRDGAVKIRPVSSVPGAEDVYNKFKPVSVPTLFRRVSEQLPSNVALAVKRDGLWKTWTYKDYYDQSRIVAKAFIKLGLQRFYGVAVLGFNSPEWLLSEMGAILAGLSTSHRSIFLICIDCITNFFLNSGIAAGIYTTNSPEASHHILSDSKANICVVENELHLKKILQVRDRLPDLRAIVQFTGKPTTEGVLSWDELLEIGRAESDDELEERLRNIAINQACLLVYTSGTTGNAKGALVSHDNMLFCASLMMIHNAHCTFGEERIVSYLPLSHAAAQALDIFSCFVIGGSVYFAQPDALKGSLIHTVREVKPTLFLGVPRIWEKMVEKLQEEEAKLGTIKRSLFQWARSIGAQYTRNRHKGFDTPPFFYGLAKSLVLDKVRHAMGMGEVRDSVSAAAPINASTLEYLHSIGIFVREGFGLTESCTGITINELNNLRFGSVGQVLDTLEIRILDPDSEGNGEILARGRNIFMGYLNLEDKTKEAVDNDGWLHSGDLGKLDKEEFLYITGRIKELVITAGGENVAPIPIEEAIKKALPVISSAMVVGDRLKFLSVLLTLKTTYDPDNVPQATLRDDAKSWCRDHGITATTVDDLLNNKNPEFDKLITAGITEANKQSVSNAQKIQKWALLPRDFSVATGELGPTLKLKRHYVLSKYKDQVEELYNC